MFVFLSPTISTLFSDYKNLFSFFYSHTDIFIYFVLYETNLENVYYTF